MFPSQPSFRSDVWAEASPQKGWWAFVGTVFAFWAGSFLAITYQRFGQSGPEASQLVRAFALSGAAAVWRLEIWRFATYAGLHGEAAPLIVNACCLLAPGWLVSKVVGARRAIAYALAGTLFGGLAAAAGGLFAPEQVVLGGSGMVAGVLAAYIALCGDDALFFVRGFAVPAWAAAAAMLLASVGLAAGESGWLGLLLAFGAIGGLLALGLEPAATRWSLRQQVRRLERRRALEGIMAEGLDKLLDKINKQGMASLSRSERVFLRKASDHFKRKHTSGTRDAPG